MIDVSTKNDCIPTQGVEIGLPQARKRNLSYFLSDRSLSFQIPESLITASFLLCFILKRNLEGIQNDAIGVELTQNVSSVTNSE